jgi:predicted DNA-binding ribbon-helix-helix protein
MDAIRDHGLRTTLVSRNVTVGGRRTSLRLEPGMWDALDEIAEREEVSVSEIATLLDRRRGGSSLTAAVRVFVLSYYRAAAGMEGAA